MTVRVCGLDIESEDFIALKSPAQSYLRQMEELVSPPEVYVPIREYDQKNDNTLIQDEPLQHCWARVSKEALQAWKLWTSIGYIEPDDLSETIKLLEKPTEAILGPDAALFQRYQRVVKVEDGRWLENQELRLARLCSERVNFSKPICEAPDTYEGRAALCCKGKLAIRVIEGLSAPADERVFHRYSGEEILERVVNSDYETNVRRTPHISLDDDEYYSNAFIDDDPDFITIEDIPGKHFTTYKPSSRPFNTVFVVTLKNGKRHIINPDKSQGRDYTSITSMEYILKQRGIQFEKLEIATSSDNEPLCEWEYDLRVTYGPSPDATNYKKVPTDSKLGARFLQLLDKNPQLMTKFTWKYDEDTSGHSKIKVAVGMHCTKDDIAGERVYWVYVDDKPQRMPAILRSKKIAPQVQYVFMPRYDHSQVLVGAVLRVSADFRSRELDHKNLLQLHFDKLRSEGFLAAGSQREAIDEGIRPCVILYKFVHQSAKDFEARCKLFMSPESYNRRQIHKSHKSQGAQKATIVT